MRVCTYNIGWAAGSPNHPGCWASRRADVAALVRSSSPDVVAFQEVVPAQAGAPVVLAVAFDRNNVFTYPGGQRDSGIEDASIVATHLTLAAAANGVDSCWLNLFDPDKVAKALNLPENESVLMLLDLGYASEGTGPLPNHDKRKSLEETVTFL